MEKEKDPGKRTREGAKNKPNNCAHLTQDEGTNSDSETVLLMAMTSNETQPRIPIEEEEELTIAPVFNKASVDLAVNSEGELIHSTLKAKAEPVEFDKAVTKQNGKEQARLVAKDFLQKVGIDYGEVYAPVARIETIRLVVAITTNASWSMHQLDVKSAFLNGPLEEVYVD
ncbi:Copia protein, partial [Mucuna pruriens]